MQFDFTRALSDGFSKEEIINAFASSMDTDINWQAVDEQYLKQGKSDEFFELLKNPSNYTIYGKKQKEQEPQEIPQNAQLNLQAPLNENAFNAQANLDKTLLKQEEPQTHTLQSPQDLSKWEHLKLAFGAETQAQTQERKAQEAQANTEIKSALKSGVAFDDLSEDLKQKAQLLGKGEISYKQDLRRDELMAKDEQGNYTLKESDLSDDDRELIKKDLGFFNSLFASEKDEFKEWRLKQEVQAQDTKTQQDLAKMQESLNNLQRYHKSGSLSLLFSNDTEKKKVQEEKLEKIQGFAENLGFDGVGVNNDGDVFAYKGDKALWLNEGFFDNFSDVLLNNSYGIAGSVAGGILGSTLAGAKAGRAIGSVGGASGQIVGGILGSAIGAFGGGILDAVNTQLKNKEEINAKFLENMLRVGNEEMLFDLAGGSVGTYVLANGKKILTAPLKATKKLSENLIATGTLKNLATTQNINAAKDLLDANIPKEVQEDLKAFANAYGGNLKMQEEVLGLTQAKEALSAKYGEDSILTKTASALEKLALENNTQNAQKELLELIRADSSGQALGILYQVAKESPKANDNLKSLLNKTTQALNKELESLNLNPQTLKEIYKELESGTKESYDIATNKVLLDLYENERITLNRGEYDNLRKQLENNAELETSALSFLKFVENSIFNPQGVGLEQLINARKTLNGFIKDTKDSNTKSYLKNIVENHLHKEINNGINKIFQSNPHFYQQATNLYNNSLSDYATMKETLKDLKKLGFLDEAKSNENLIDKFIKYIQGDGGLNSKNNFIELTKGLSEQNKQAIELNVLNRIYQRNLLKDDGIEVFASKNFLRETQKLKEVFNTKGAREFIELMEGFNKLFSNDAEIALKMGYATPRVEGSSIATTIEGAIQQKMIKGIFGILMRNLPHNSLIIKGLGLSENVQAQALRYHLKKALENTNDIHAFKTHLSQNADKQNFNSATQQILKEILGEVDTLKNEVLRESENYKNAYEKDTQAQVKSDIQPLKMLESGELDEALLKQAQERNLKLWVGNLENEQLAKELGLDSKKPIRITMQGNAITHIEKRHGANSIMAQNGQPSIQIQDYANHAQIVNTADKSKVILSDDNQRMLVSGKQVNGYYIIVESISTKKNELKLKTMYKENGRLEDSAIFKSARALTDHNNGGESLRLNPSNSLDFHAQQNLTTKERIKQARDLGLNPKEAVEFIKGVQNKEILREVDTLKNEVLREGGNYKFASTKEPEAPNLSPKTPQEAQEILESITPAQMPAHLSEQEFLNGFSHIVNKENFLAHLQKAQDSKERIQALNLVEPTRLEPDLVLDTHNVKGEATKDFIKAFQNRNGSKFYVLVTQRDNENFLLTGIPISRKNKIIKRINNAEAIKARDFQGISTLLSHTSPELNANLTTKERIKQARDLGLNPKEAVEFIKTSNLPQTRANTIPQNREVLEAEIIEPQEIPYLQKELLEWIQQRPHLITPNQQARLRTKDLIEFAREQKLPPRQAVQLLNNTPRNLPMKVDLDKPKINATSKLTAKQLRELPKATQQEYTDFLQKVASKDYANAPYILKIATLNKELQALMNSNKNIDVFITRSRAGHISQNRKGAYNQALTFQEQAQIPTIINQAKEVYVGGGSGYVIPFKDLQNAQKMNLIILNTDENGNFLITAKKINTRDFENPMYQKLARAGVEPATTTPKKEQKPTEAISLANEILPQNQEKLKQIEAFKKEFNLSEDSFKPLGSISEDGEILTEKGYFKVLKVNEKDGYVIAFESIEQYRGVYYFNKPMIYDLQGRYLGAPYIDGQKVKNATELFTELDEIKPFTIGKNKTIQQALSTIKPKKIFADGYNENLVLVDKVIKTKTRDGKEVNVLKIDGIEKDPITGLGTGDITKADYKTYKEAIQSIILKQKEAPMFKVLEKGINAEFFSDLQKQVAKEILEKVKDKNAVLILQKEHLENKLETLNKNGEWLKQNRPELYNENSFNTSGEKLKQEIAEIEREILQTQQAQNLPPKQAVYLINNTPRNLPIKVESTQKVNANAQNVNTKNVNEKGNIENNVKDVENVESKDLKTLRAQTKEALKPYTQQKITNKGDNTQAVLTHKGISEMLSAKAIAQSVNNGFTKAQHLQAVQNIKDLFESAVFKESQAPKHPKNDVLAYRIYNAPFENANAVISVQERKVNDDVLYFVKLENLQPMQNEASAFTSNLQGLKSKVDNPAERQTLPSLDSEKIIPQQVKTTQEIIKEAKDKNVILKAQNPTKAQIAYFNPFMNEYEKIKEIKKLHTQDDNLIRVMKVDGRNDYIEPLSNMSVSKEYLQKQTAQSLKEQITQAILGNQTQLKALQQGYNTYHLSTFQKEVLESALDIANNPTKYKEYKLQGLQKQLDNLNSNEAYHIEKSREYDKARYAKDRQELEKEISALKGTESSLESVPQKVESSDIVFTDKKGKQHTLTKEVAQQWLETFNLKSLDETYTPQHTQEIKQALGGKEIRLQLGSLKKLVAQGREQYIPQIKEVLDSPEAIMRDDMGEYLFIKHLKDDDYFVNVSFDNGEYLVSISNGIKETRNLNNKLEKGGSFIYQSPNFNSISQKLLQTSQYSANKIDSDIIPQTESKIINEQLLTQREKLKEQLEFARLDFQQKKNDSLDKINQQINTIREEELKGISEYDIHRIPIKNVEDKYKTPLRTIKKLYKERDEIYKIEKPLELRELETKFKRAIIEEVERLANKSLTLEEVQARINPFTITTPREYEYVQSLLNDYLKLENREYEEKLTDAMQDYIQRQTAEFLNLKYFKTPQVLFKPLGLERHEYKQMFNLTKVRLGIDYKEIKNDLYAPLRAKIEKFLNIKPLKEFGENYAEHYHNGKGAIQKLLAESKDFKESGKKGEYKGQVAGAFYRKELGDIDLVWGEVTDPENHKGYGLAHILDKRKAEFMQQGLSESEAEAKARELINNIPNIISKGEVIKDEKGRLRIELNNQILGIKDNWQGTPTNKWIITSYEARENAGSLYTSPTITKGETLPLNSSDIIPQQTIESTMKKFNYDEKKARDLLEWHKDSSPLTKDENGLPKVFYHGSKEKDFEIFERQEKGKFDIGFWFSDNKAFADKYTIDTLSANKGSLYKVFLNMKNPFSMNAPLNESKKAEIHNIFTPTNANKNKAEAELNKWYLAKDELRKNNLELQEYIPEHIIIRDTKNGELFQIGHEHLLRKNRLEDIEDLSGYADSKDFVNKLKAFDDLVGEAKFDNLVKITHDYPNEYFKNDVEFYITRLIDKTELEKNIKNLYETKPYMATHYAVLRRQPISSILKQKGYDGIVFANDEFVVFDSNQIKHIENKGQNGTYFNDSSPNIYQSNPHLGSGLVGGSVAGIEEDENGNLTFSPEKFALGLLGGVVGSKAVAKGFAYLKENPQVKEAVARELANTLALGFDKAKAKYPALSLLEPRYIVQNEKGRKIQAKSMLKELEKEQKGLYNVAFNGKNAVLIQKDLENIDEAILLQKGTKRKGGKHIRLAHSTDKTQEGYVTKNEVVNLGKDIRQFLKEHKEPFIDTNGARLYEWEKDSARFRVVVNDIQDSGGNSLLPSASEEIITFYSDRNLKEKMEFKNPVLKVQEKFNFNPQKARDLLEWHKDSSPLTKDENGLPKVFYHGSKEKDFEIFERQEKGKFDIGFWFSDNKAFADKYTIDTLSANKGSLYKVFLNMKNPFSMNAPLNESKKAEIHNIFTPTNANKNKAEAELNKWYLAKDELRKNNLELQEYIPEHIIIRDTKNGELFQIGHEHLLRKNRLEDIEDLSGYADSKDFVNKLKAFDDLVGEAKFDNLVKITHDYPNEYFKNDVEFYITRLIDKTELEKNIKNLYETKPYMATHYAVLRRQPISSILKQKGYDGIVFANDEFVVFDSNQIKHIENKGQNGTYFNDSSPNIYQSNPHLGSGLVGGSVAGIEEDENGNLSFNAEKFALGLLGGVVGSKAVAKGLEWRANKVAKSYPNIAKDNPTLMSEIAKRDLATYARTNAYNTITRFLNNNKILDVNPQLFAGEKALINEAYAPHKARLEKAKELESKGADEIEIWEKTGWYKDKDKKWKFEISQRGGEFDYQSLKKQSDYYKESLPLAEFLHDEKLYQAYPELMDLKILATYDDGRIYKDVKGQYNGDYIFLNTKHLTTDEKAKSILYHELQHAIQDIEGFAYGYKKPIDFRGGFDKYKKQHGEVEARNVEARLNSYGDIHSKQSLKDEIEKLKNTLLSAKKYDPDTAKILADRIEKYEKNYKNLGEYDIYNTRKHPYKTMDTHINDTIAEATMQGEALSKELESSFLDSNGKIDYKALESFAIPLPKPTDIQTFSQNLLNSKNATPNKAKNRVAYKTPAGVVNIYIPYAYRHFGKQGNKKENRFNITGVLIHILDNPTFVTRDEAGTLYFYKPFKNANNIIDIVSISIAKNGKIEYRTTYEATKGRLKQMITRHDLIYMGHKEVAT